MTIMPSNIQRLRKLWHQKSNETWTCFKILRDWKNSTQFADCRLQVLEEETTHVSFVYPEFCRMANQQAMLWVAHEYSLPGAFGLSFLDGRFQFPEPLRPSIQYCIQIPRSESECLHARANVCKTRRSRLTFGSCYGRYFL